MNNQIKDLAEQAGLQTYYEAQTSDIEKFAELIIRSCIAKCDDYDSQYFIAHHFGIQQYSTFDGDS